MIALKFSIVVHGKANEATERTEGLREAVKVTHPDKAHNIQKAYM